MEADGGQSRPIPRLPHLHVHLEPARRAGSGARPAAASTSNAREDFFAGHSSEARTAHEQGLGLDDLRHVVRRFVAAQARDVADHVEVRLSPRRWMQNGITPTDFLAAAHEQLAGTTRPVVRGIVLVNRATDASDVAAILDALERAPPTIVGVDVAGDERIRSADHLIGQVFDRAASLGLGATAHAGEWGPAERIWHAIDVLGVHRVAHAASAPDDAALVDRLVRDRVLVEVSLGSNLVLGRFDSVDAHPVRRMVEAGIAVCFNSDIPVHTGLDLAAELELATRALACSAADVMALQSQAAEWSFGLRTVARASPARQTPTVTDTG